MTATATATLQMIRAEVNVREFQRWMGVKRLQDPGHAMHCLLTECFGRPPNEKCPERDGIAPQPFRLIIPRGAASGCLYGYGQADADALRDAAAICCDPLQSRILPANRIDSKPMPTEFQADKRLGFEVRLRPVIRKARGSGHEEAELDAFQVKAETFPKGKMPHSREEVYAQWLSEQLERHGGAKLDVPLTRLVSFQRTRAVRKLHRRPSEGPDAVMQGNLTVTDPAKFAAMLARGIGRHRAYGYGMLLLRPARG